METALPHESPAFLPPQDPRCSEPRYRQEGAGGRDGAQLTAAQSPLERWGVPLPLALVFPQSLTLRAELRGSRAHQPHPPRGGDQASWPQGPPGNAHLCSDGWRAGGLASTPRGCSIMWVPPARPRPEPQKPWQCCLCQGHGHRRRHRGAWRGGGLPVGAGAGLKHLAGFGGVSSLWPKFFHG